MPLRSVAGSWKRCGRSPSLIAGKSAGGRHCSVKRERPARITRLPPSDAALELDLRAVRQLADDLVERMGRRRGRAGLGRIRLDRLGDGEVHVGRRQAEPALLGGDQDVGQDRDRVPPLDDTLHMGQRLQKGCPFDRQFHDLVAVTRGQKSGLDTPFRRLQNAPAERSESIARGPPAGSDFARNLRRLEPVSPTKTGPRGPRFTVCSRDLLALQLPLEQLDVFCNRQVGDLELLDLAHGMHDRGVVAVAEALADLRQAQAW